MAACGVISAGVVLSCTNPLKGGVNPNVWIANFDDVASITIDGTNSQIATAIVMQTDKVWYVYEGLLKSTEPLAQMVKGTYYNSWDHQVRIRIFAIDPTAKKQVANKAGGRFMMIINNNHKGTTGNSKYEIYGWGCGMYAESIERAPQSTDTLGAWDILFKTAEHSRESGPPLTFFVTSESATDAALEALVAGS